MAMCHHAKLAVGLLDTEIGGRIAECVRPGLCRGWCRIDVELVMQALLHRRGSGREVSLIVTERGCIGVKVARDMIDVVLHLLFVPSKRGDSKRPEVNIPSCRAGPV